MSTIKDVAALAGVSYTTVSHVINKTRPVSDKVRGEVEAAIRRLNYVPSAVARSLKQQSTSTIGLLVSNSSNPFFAELAQGIEDICYRAGYTVILCNSDDQPERQQTYLRVLLEKRIDGLIICSAGDDLGLAEHLREAKMPVIIVDRAVKGVTSDLVQIDHFKGGYLATTAPARTQAQINRVYRRTRYDQRQCRPLERISKSSRGSWRTVSIRMGRDGRFHRGRRI